MSSTVKEGIREEDIANGFKVHTDNQTPKYKYMLVVIQKMTSVYVLLHSRHLAWVLMLTLFLSSSHMNEKINNTQSCPLVKR